MNLGVFVNYLAIYIYFLRRNMWIKLNKIIKIVVVFEYLKFIFCFMGDGFF